MSPPSPTSSIPRFDKRYDVRVRDLAKIGEFGENGPTLNCLAGAVCTFSAEELSELRPRLKRPPGVLNSIRRGGAAATGGGSSVLGSYLASGGGPRPLTSVRGWIRKLFAGGGTANAVTTTPTVPPQATSEDGATNAGENASAGRSSAATTRSSGTIGERRHILAAIVGESVVGLDAATGSEIWKTPTGRRINSIQCIDAHASGGSQAKHARGDVEVDEADEENGDKNSSAAPPAPNGDLHGPLLVTAGECGRICFLSLKSGEVVARCANLRRRRVALMKDDEDTLRELAAADAVSAEHVLPESLCTYPDGTAPMTDDQIALPSPSAASSQTSAAAALPGASPSRENTITSGEQLVAIREQERENANEGAQIQRARSGRTTTASSFLGTTSAAPGAGDPPLTPPGAGASRTVGNEIPYDPSAGNQAISPTGANVESSSSPSRSYFSPTRRPVTPRAIHDGNIQQVIGLGVPSTAPTGAASRHTPTASPQNATRNSSSGARAAEDVVADESLPLQGQPGASSLPSPPEDGTAAASGSAPRGRDPPAVQNNDPAPPAPFSPSSAVIGIPMRRSAEGSAIHDPRLLAGMERAGLYGPRIRGESTWGIRGVRMQLQVSSCSDASSSRSKSEDRVLLFVGGNDHMAKLVMCDLKKHSASERDSISNANWTSSPSRDPSAAPATAAVADHALHARTTRSLSVGEEPEQEESSEGPAARRAAGDHSAPAAATRRRRRSFASLTVDTSTAPAPADDLSSASQEPRDSVAPRPPKRAKLTRSTILESAKGVGNIPCCDLTSNGQFAAWTCLDGRLRVARIREHVQPGVALPPSVLNSTNHPLGFSSTSSTRGGLLQAPGRVTPSHTATSVPVQNGVTQPAANPSGPVSFPVEIREVVSSLSLEQFSTHQGHRSLLARAEREHLAGLGQHQQHLDRARQEEEDEQRRLEARTQALWLVQQAESLNASVSVVGGAPGVTVGDHGGGTTEDDATDQETGSDNDAGRAQERVSRGHGPSPSSRNSLPLVREEHQGLPLPLSSSSSSSASSESCRPVDVAQLGGATIPREGTTGTASSSSSQPPHGAAASVAASVAAVAAVDPTAAAVNNRCLLNNSEGEAVGNAVRGPSSHAQLPSAGAVGAVSIAASGAPARATSSGMFSPSSPSLHVHPSAYANLSQGPGSSAVLLGELRASDPLLQRNHSLNLAGLRRLIDWHWHVCFLDTSSVPATTDWKPLFDLDTTNSALSTYRNSYGGDNDHISFNHHDLAGSGGRERGMVGGMISRLGGQLLSASIIGGPSSRGGSPGGRALSPSTARMLADSFDGTRTGTTQGVAGSTLYYNGGSTSSTDSDLRRRYWRLIRGFFQMPETARRSDDGSFLTSGRGSSAGAQHQASPGPVDADLHAGTVFASVGGGDESPPGGGGAPAAESQHLREVVHQFDRGRSPASQQHPQRTDDYLLQSTIIDWN